MATPKITAPNPAAWNSDPIEQIYAKGTLDRDMSGLAFMFANAAQDRGDRNAGQYMQGVQAANKQAMQLSQEEERNKMLLEVLKGSLDLAKNGYQPANMPSLGAVFNDVNAADVREPSAAANALLRAKAIQALTSGSGGGGEQTSVEGGVNEMGMPTELKFKNTRSKDPVASATLIDQLVADYVKRRKVGSGNPTAYPSIDQANKAAQDAARKRYPGVQ